MIAYILGWIMKLEGLLMLIPVLVALIIGNTMACGLPSWQSVHWYLEQLLRIKNRKVMCFT